MLRRGLWLVVVVVVIAVVATVFFSRRQHKVFSSSAVVFLGSQSAAASLTSGSQQANPATDSITQALLAETPVVARRALRIARLAQRDPESLLAASSVVPGTTADILTFTIHDPDPTLATRLANSFAKAYTEYRAHLDTAGIANALTDIDARIEELKKGGLDTTAAYADLLDKQQQLSTLQVLEGSNALLLRPATGAAQIQPRPLRNGAIAGVLGLILGLGLVLLAEALNTRVRSAAEAETLLGLPQLGRIPEPPRRYRKHGGLLMLGDPQNPLAEAYRILGTNLDFVNLEVRARTIMFTSATHGEGKSTTITNLAVALARAGRRVVLVDLDLRKPVVGRMFRLDERKGITTVALGRDDLAGALESITLPNAVRSPQSNGSATQDLLDVLAVGPLPPNPAEFVGSQVLDSILHELEERAELVLIDAPPLLNLSDAVTLTGHVDGVVIVTRLPLIRRSALQELRRVLDATPVAKLGFVVTGSAADSESYGGYGYGYTPPSDRRRAEQEELQR